MTDTYQKMLGALHESVTSIVAAPEAEREGLMKTTFDQFADAMSEYINTECTDAFEAGTRGDLRKFLGTDNEELMKGGLTHVAEVATLVQTAERGIELMKGVYTEEQLTPGVREALDHWVELGKGILSGVVGEVGFATAENDLQKTEADEQLQKSADAIREASDQIRQRMVKLAKAIPAAGAGGSGDDPSAMNPLEIIGRLAAAILVQVDAIMPDDESTGDMADDDGASAGAPPPEANEPDGDEGKPGPGDGDGDEGADQGEPKKKVPPQFAKKSEEADDLKKVEATPEDLEKAHARVKELEEELAKRNAEPAPAKGAVKEVVVADKTQDSALAKAEGDKEDELKKQAEELSKLPPQERATALIKMIQSKGGRKVA